MSRRDSRNDPSGTNQNNTLLSFEKEGADFAATGQFKILNTDSAGDGAFCQLGSGKTFLDGDTDENERHEPIFGDA